VDAQVVGVLSCVVLFSFITLQDETFTFCVGWQRTQTVSERVSEMGGEHAVQQEPERWPACASQNTE
jgi:hypothetical protein